MENLLVQLRKGGVISFVRRALRFILRKSIGLDWRTGIIVERSLEKPIEEIETRISAIIRQATINDLDTLKGIVNDSKLELFKKRFKKGRICFIALDGERVCSFAWVSFENEYENDCRMEIKLHEGEGYIFDSYTVPEYRGSGFQTALISKRLAYLKDQGFRRAVAFVWDDNIPSLKACRSVSFEKGKTVTLVTLLGLRFHRWRKSKGDL